MGTNSKPNMDTNVKIVKDTPITLTPYHLFLRFLALLLTLIATIIVAVDKETKIISYAGMQFKATAKWEYMSAIVFFLVSNAIACSYAAVSLVITTMTRRSGKENVAVLVVTVVDLVIMALLFSANGAACAVGIIGRKGNSHVQWMKVCNVFDAYCRHVTAALAISLIGSTLFLLLVVHSLFKFHYTSS